MNILKKLGFFKDDREEEITSAELENEKARKEFKDARARLDALIQELTKNNNERTDHPCK